MADSPSTLSLKTAVELVRKNLDEIEPNGSDLYPASGSLAAEDNVSLDTVIIRSLPEAINAVHLLAPVETLEWTSISTSGVGGANDITECTVDSSDTKKVLTVKLKSGINFLRLVSFKAKDSGIVITEVTPEASVNGRKQANKYIRGQYDKPVLVMAHGSFNAPVFHYYSLKEAYTGSGAQEQIDYLRIVKEQSYDSSYTISSGSYNISGRLKQNIIDYLTGLVMRVFSDARADYFIQKANIFSNI